MRDSCGRTNEPTIITNSTTDVNKRSSSNLELVVNIFTNYPLSGTAIRSSQSCKCSSTERIHSTIYQNLSEKVSILEPLRTLYVLVSHERTHHPLSNRRSYFSWCIVQSGLVYRVHSFIEDPTISSRMLIHSPPNSVFDVRNSSTSMIYKLLNEHR